MCVCQVEQAHLLRKWLLFGWASPELAARAAEVAAVDDNPFSADAAAADASASAANAWPLSSEPASASVASASNARAHGEAAEAAAIIKVRSSRCHQGHQAG